VLAAALGAAPAHAAQTWALETVRVSNTAPTPVTTRVALDAGHRHRLTVSGTISDLCTTTSCPKGDPAKVAQANVGVDGVWRDAKWRCPTPEPWQQLVVNGKGILDFTGLKPEDTPNSAGHRYSFEFEGVSGPLSLGCWDALAGSGAGNSGAFTVTITDLGPSGAEPPASAATRKLQSDLAKLGFFTGPQDGRLDARTTDAIRRFQLDAGSRPTASADSGASRRSRGPSPEGSPSRSRRRR
jgi:hypothetical protein